MAQLRFLGAAGTVTGSKHLLETDGHRVMVDCGLYQGLKELRERNWAPLPVSPRGIEDVVLTHAHVDHTGYLPALVRNGFVGKVWCTPATLDLTRILLRDSAHLQEEDARYANRKGFSRHKPALPLYTPEDAEDAIKLLKPVPYGKFFQTASGNVKMRLSDAGHILGSALVEAWLKDSKGSPIKVVFSGDVGRPDAPIVDDLTVIADADYILLESTYGDRIRPPDQVEEQLAAAVNEAVETGGVLLIPAFAVERTQDLLYLLSGLWQERKIPHIPIVVDSPMAVDATKVFLSHPDLWDEEARARAGKLFLNHDITFSETVQQSKAINQRRGPFILISSSGMASAGRVVHHMARLLPDPRNIILVSGYQVLGTRGRLLVDGIRWMKIHGQEVPVRARVRKLGGLSGHADADQLVAWLRGFEKKPRTVFLVHGEPEACEALAARIKEKLGLHCHVPRYLETVEL